jgi:hypothetical protein
MKKLILVSLLAVFVFSSGAMAQSPFTKLPFGLEFDKPVPKKLFNRSEVSNSSKKWYDFDELFYFQIDENSNLIGLSYGGTYLKNKKLPKAWRNLGIKLCKKGRVGTTKEEFKKILKTQKGILMKPRKDFEFEVDGKYRITAKFKSGEDCQGLSDVYIKADGFGEY